MERTAQEALFDSLVLLAAGLAHVSYMLGIGVNPLPTLAVGATLVGIGAVTIAPRNARVPAALTGVLGVVLAGAVVPLYAARAVRPGETLAFSLLLAGVVLLLTFAVLRITSFRPRPTRA